MERGVRAVVGHLSAASDIRSFGADSRYSVDVEVLLQGTIQPRRKSFNFSKVRVLD